MAAEGDTQGPIVLTGQCLCGGVRYRITGVAKRFYHCHCARCRRASGTGHAASRALWSCGGDELPQHEEGPPL